ncbi:MAG: SDR family oxidoreductase [Rhodospirillales bacterium]|nr:SDR family oxidoreductase [Rhodospirillales bacterium]
MPVEPARKVAVVTGAAGGLGRALCRRFARDGMGVAALDRDAAGLALLARDGIPVVAIAADITDVEACRRAAAEVRDRLGAADVLVNNAGITHFSTFAEAGAEVVRRVLEVNFLGAVHATEAFLPQLVARRGAIAAISSVAGFSPLYGRSGYSASKHALHGFFDTLRAELKDDGVAVTLVCPSFIATQAVIRGAGPSDGGIARPGMAAQTAGRPLSPERVADAVVDALRRRRRRVVIGRLAHLSYWLNAFAPAAFERAMLRRIRPEFD